MIRSIERTWRGFRLHLEDGSVVLRVSKRDRRVIEAAFRNLGVPVVDEYGARIDESQFEKELVAPEQLRDPDAIGAWRLVALMLTPNWFLGWRDRRRVRQSSDDAGG